MPKDLFKVNTEQIFILWRNLAVSYLALILGSIFTSILPSILAPITPLLLAGGLYFYVYSNYYSRLESCVVLPYAMFIILVTYSLVLVLLNLLNAWTIIEIPYELVFFDGVYVPSLLRSIVGFVVSIIIYIRRRHLSICVDCKLSNGSPLDRGRAGIIFSTESELQLKNLIKIFAIIMVLTWGYYFYEYSATNITNRDQYVFVWMSVVLFLLNILYYGMRYYNLYLDLKERNELLSPEEVSESCERTYAMFYVICGDSVYLTDHSVDALRDDDDGDLLGTPFLTKRNMSQIPISELKTIISRMTGVKDGELKFFYGRKVADAAGRRMLRYFYFLPGDIADYPELATKGLWISSDKLKTIYNKMPDRLTSQCLADFSRMATIMITRKTYDENGDRRNKLTHYRPTFSLQEIADSDIDFQDDKWIRVSMFNSDKRFFKIKRWFRAKWRRSGNDKRKPFQSF